MKRAARMRRIIGLARNAQTQAAQRVASARDDMLRQQQQLEQFRRYLTEYDKSLAAGTERVGATRAREIKRFMEQLQQAIDSLEHGGERASAEFERSVAVWQKESRRGNALADIADAALRASEQRDELSSQYELDDFIARRY